MLEHVSEQESFQVGKYMFCNCCHTIWLQGIKSRKEQNEIVRLIPGFTNHFESRVFQVTMKFLSQTISALIWRYPQDG